MHILAGVGEPQHTVTKAKMNTSRYLYLARATRKERKKEKDKKLGRKLAYRTQPRRKGSDKRACPDALVE